MWTSSQTRDTEKKILNWQDFKINPHQAISNGQSIDAAAIASYLRQLLENYEESEFIKYLVAPSPIALSGFFRCNQADIYSALLELERQGYETETTSHSAPIVLWDPLIRTKTVRRNESPMWHQFYQMLISPKTQTALS